LVGLASAIDSLLRDAGRPRPHEATRLAISIGTLIERLANLSEALSATEADRMEAESAETYRAAVGQLRASVAGLQRGARALR
jgi:ABC-type transporter Mla subunit MlaD